MKKITAFDAKEIRAYLGHALPECRVVIHKNGEIERYGSSDLSNRSKDFWSYMGTTTEWLANLNRGN
tara:strand:+ start:713 stop:913 length:201 start_codon:yes stop_codon:yes gene_type:complete